MPSRDDYSDSYSTNCNCRKCVNEREKRRDCHCKSCCKKKAVHTCENSRNDRCSKNVGYTQILRNEMQENCNCDRCVEKRCKQTCCNNECCNDDECKKGKVIVITIN